METDEAVRRSTTLSGEEIKRRAKAAGVPIWRIAYEAEIVLPRVYNILNGREVPTEKMERQLARAIHRFELDRGEPVSVERKSVVIHLDGE